MLSSLLPRRNKELLKPLKAESTFSTIKEVQQTVATSQSLS
jgi:hypothetical protein